MLKQWLRIGNIQQSNFPSFQTVLYRIELILSLFRELKDRQEAALTPVPPVALQYLYGGSAVVQTEQDVTPQVSLSLKLIRKLKYFFSFWCLQNVILAPYMHYYYYYYYAGSLTGVMTLTHYLL